MNVSVQPCGTVQFDRLSRAAAGRAFTGRAARACAALVAAIGAEGKVSDGSTFYFTIPEAKT